MKLVLEKYRTWLVGLGLAAITWLTIWPMADNGFTDYDDPFYVTKNPEVQAGLTLPGVKWAFTTLHVSNWHPVTWLSHMLDCEWFGLNPRGHHLVNMAWHTLNTVLLFVLLRRLTGFLWRSAVVAALFALHPMHVESVAWISERKDVLSMFFFLLCLLAYAAYVAHRTNGLKAKATTAYVLTLLLFGMGLLSKPMLVTLPCVLLLLDFWPLGRVEWIYTPENVGRFMRLILEKIPFFLLTLASCYITIVAQSRGGAVASIVDIGFDDRIANSIIAYGWYVLRLFWPIDQALIYPLFSERSNAALAGGALVLIIVTALAWWQAKRRPWLLFGWLWFIGTLVPVIGLLQVGMQNYADRYTYLSYVGLFIIVVWPVAEVSAGWKFRHQILIPAGTAMLIACGLATRKQIGFWKDSETLHRRALAVTKDNYIAMSNLAFTLQQRGRYEEAIALTEQAIALIPTHSEAYDTMGCARLGQKQPELAAEAFAKAVFYQPQNAFYQNNLGTALHLQKQYQAAVAAYKVALQIDPAYPEGHYNLANSFSALGRSDEAIASYNRALHHRPSYADATLNLALEFLRHNRRAEAQAVLERASATNPAESRFYFLLGRMANEDGDFATAEARLRRYLADTPKHLAGQLQLVIALVGQKKIEAAVSLAQELVQQSPEHAEAHHWFAVALTEAHRAGEAIEQYDRVLQLAPDHTEALNNLAWLLVSVPDAAQRDGARAIKLAQQACELTHNESPFLLGTLAAAYAETGAFPKAIATAEQARDLAQQKQLPAVATKNTQLLELYHAGKTARDLPP